MSNETFETLDIREKLAHIDQMLAAHDRDRQEMYYNQWRVPAHIDQMLAEHNRRLQEIRFAPWLVAFAGMTAGAALLGVGVALGAGILRWHGV